MRETDPLALAPETVRAGIDRVLDRAGAAGGRLALDPEHVERDLARLLLGLMEFLRQVLELQAIRRVEAGSLTEDEEERVGLALMRAEGRILELASAFGLAPGDVRLDLGLEVRG